MSNIGHQQPQSTRYNAARHTEHGHTSAVADSRIQQPCFGAFNFDFKFILRTGIYVEKHQSEVFPRPFGFGKNIGRFWAVCDDFFLRNI